MTEASGLDDPYHAQFAWARFRRIFRAIATLAVIVGLGVAGLIWWLRGPLPWAFTGMVFAGVCGTIMMAALLMGLVFLSSGTGHDHSIPDLLSEELLGDDEL